MIKNNIEFNDIISEKLDTISNSDNISDDRLSTNSGSGSGGYAHHIFRHAAQKLFNINVEQVLFTPLR